MTCKVAWCQEPVYRAKLCRAHWEYDRGRRLERFHEVTRRCSACGQLGHNRLTCGVKREKPPETPLAAAFRREAAKW